MIKVVCIGAGYFAPFHVEAWKRITDVEVLAICDQDIEKARTLATQYHIPNVFSDVDDMLHEVKADVMDIITPPATHLEICKKAVQMNMHIICQKPLAPTFSEAQVIANLLQDTASRFMVHENFRFQPWHRQIKKLIDDGAIGNQLHQLYFRMRTGDGWSANAYKDRQPYFRVMPRLLVHETGIHYIDTFRYIAGEVKNITANLRRLNPNIAGEDSAILFFEFENGATGIWDANRYNEPNHKNARYTFGAFLVEGNGGSIRLYLDGRITLQQLGKEETEIVYKHEDRNFAGDCVYYTQQHFVHALQQNLPFETNIDDYLKNLALEEKIYETAIIKHT